MLEGLMQPMHLILILVIIMIFFGPGKLPEVGAGLGKSIKAFKNAMKEDDPKTAAITLKEEDSKSGTITLKEEKKA